MNLLLLALALLSTLSLQDSPVKRVRYPSLSPDSKTLAFSYQGDIWICSTEGGKAERLTIHPASDTFPQFSPDGKWIAFSSNRYGTLDLFRMRADGSALERITYMPGDEYVMGWTSDSKWILFQATRWGGMDIHKVSAGGGEPLRLTIDDMEWEYFPSVSKDGKKIAYCHGGSPGNWRRLGLKGSSTADIWIADFDDLMTAKNVTKDDSPQMWPMWSPDNRTIYYVGDDGTANLWKMNPDGSGKRKLTNHVGDRVRYPSMSAEGNAIAYEYDSEIWIYDIRTNKTRKVDIKVPADQRSNPYQQLTLTSGVTEYAISPNGKRIAFALRGEIFVIPESGGYTKRMTNYAGRDAQPIWKDDENLFFITSREGNLDIYSLDFSGNAKPFVSSPQDENGLSLSPDRKTLAFHRGTNEICVIPVEGGDAKVVATGHFAGTLFGNRAYSWAPDSRHIVYATATERGGSNVEIVDIQNGKTTRIAMVARDASNLRFTPDGKRVLFIANEFEWNESDLFIVDLVPEPVQFEEETLEKTELAKEPEKPKPVTLTIDTRRIFERMRALTRGGGVIDAIPSADSKTIYVIKRDDISSQIYRIPATGGSLTPLTTASASRSDLSLSADSKTLYFIESSRIASLPTTGGTPSAKTIRAEIDFYFPDEARALFEEIWWVMDRTFYDPTHHGIDWKAIKQKYENLIPFAYDRTEFYDLMSEMMGELKSSHVGVSAPPQPPVSTDAPPAILGVEPDWKHLEKTGEYKIAHIYPDSPADHPETRLQIGDAIVAIDGTKLDGKNPIDKLLTRKEGKRIFLDVKDSGGAMRKVAIKPISFAQQDELVYQEFVARSRDLVDRYSNGEIAYVHIRAMSPSSHDLFRRQVRTLPQGKKALVIDVRYNGGGSTAHLALGMLIKTPWLIRSSRLENIRISENLYRGDAIELPSALVINARSFSNAEIFAEGFRRLKIGPIVGVETAGGVIGTGSWSLFDGGSLRTPVVGAYTVDGENLEGNGRKPDFPVPYDPAPIAKGEDPMLKKAVEVVSKKVK